MKRTFLLLILTMVFATAKAQLYNWEFGVTAGGANYVGDISSAATTQRGEKLYLATNPNLKFVL